MISKKMSEKKCHKISQMTVKIIVINIEYVEATEIQPQTDYL